MLKCISPSLVVLAALAAPLQAAPQSPAPSPALKLINPPVKGGKKASPEQKKAAALQKSLEAAEKTGRLDAADDKEGTTALMLAADQQQRLAACYLIARGADVALRDKSGKSALEYARSAELRELINACSGSVKTPVEHENKIRQLRELGLNDPQSSVRKLRELIAADRLGELARLISFGAEMYDKSLAEPPLLEQPGTSPECIALLCRKGYNINTKGKDGASPLCAGISPAAVRLLLALGLKPGERAEARLIAALAADDAKIAADLLAKESALAQPGLFVYASSAKGVKLLIDAGADPKQAQLVESILQQEPAYDASALQALLAADAPLPEPAALIRLCAAGRVGARCLSALLQAGMDARAADAEGNTALHYAAAHGAAAAVKALLAAGADANAANAAGNPPLIFCLQNTPTCNPSHSELPDTLRALLKAGADPKAKSADGKSASALAKALGREDLVKLMHGR